MPDLNDSPMLPCGSSSYAKVAWYLRQHGTETDGGEGEEDHLCLNADTDSAVTVVDGKVLAPGMYLFSVCAPNSLNKSGSASNEEHVKTSTIVCQFQVDSSRAGIFNKACTIENNFDSGTNSPLGFSFQIPHGLVDHARFTLTLSAKSTSAGSVPWRNQQATPYKTERGTCVRACLLWMPRPPFSDTEMAEFDTLGVGLGVALNFCAAFNPRALLASLTQSTDSVDALDCEFGGAVISKCDVGDDPFIESSSGGWSSSARAFTASAVLIKRDQEGLHQNESLEGWVDDIAIASDEDDDDEEDIVMCAISLGNKEDWVIVNEPRTLKQNADQDSFQVNGRNLDFGTIDVSNGTTAATATKQSTTTSDDATTNHADDRTSTSSPSQPHPLRCTTPLHPALYSPVSSVSSSSSPHPSSSSSSAAAASLVRRRITRTAAQGSQWRRLQASTGLRFEGSLHVITEPIFGELLSRLPSTMHCSSTWKVVYRLQQHGASARALLKHCKPHQRAHSDHNSSPSLSFSTMASSASSRACYNSGPQFLVIKDTKGRIFGGFVIEGWTNTYGSFVDSSCAFVFKWDPETRRLHTYQHKRANGMVRLSSETVGIAMGAGSCSSGKGQGGIGEGRDGDGGGSASASGFAFCVDDELHLGTSCQSNTFGSPCLTGEDDEPFVVADLEIFARV